MAPVRGVDVEGWEHIPVLRVGRRRWEPERHAVLHEEVCLVHIKGVRGRLHIGGSRPVDEHLLYLNVGVMRGKMMNLILAAADPILLLVDATAGPEHLLAFELRRVVT